MLHISSYISTTVPLGTLHDIVRESPEADSRVNSGAPGAERRDITEQVCRIVTTVDKMPNIRILIEVIIRSMYK